MSTLLVNIAGVVLIALIVWWFWLSKPKLRRLSSDEIEIIVDNGVYSPARIEIPVGKTTKLKFIRKDPSPCAEKVLIDGLQISADLPINEAVVVSINPEQAGDYEFTCQMRMYRGNLIAK